MASQTSANKPQSAMAALLAKHQSKFVPLRKGESVKGKITKLSSGEITVDVGAKTEAVVLEKDRNIMHTILSMFKVGDTVEVNVLNPESENGNPVVSLRRFLGDISWKKLDELEKSKEAVEVMVAEATKAGYLVTTGFGVSGFLPQSHVSQGDLSVGQSVKVTVLELNRKDNKIIFSQKPAVSGEDFAKVIKALKIGDKVKAKITNVSSFGIFVTFQVNPSAGSGQVLEGFIHISEVAWDKVDDLTVMYKAGDEIDAAISRFDEENRRVNLSIKRLTKDPFEKRMEEYPVDKKVSGEVINVSENGVTVALAEGVEGFIKKEKIPPTTTYTTGQTVIVTVAEHDKRKHKIIVVPVLKEKPLMYR
ncbi:S1 RNA-binding domain-containing protein [Candidatus Gottesmanbacteria bacterium]|nr:S1 RNA-binding domain-containing protein [Candidatus Gottesmanbacteria bacterium]